MQISKKPVELKPVAIYDDEIDNPYILVEKPNISGKDYVFKIMANNGFIKTHEFNDCYWFANKETDQMAILFKAKHKRKLFKKVWLLQYS